MIDQSKYSNSVLKRFRKAIIWLYVGSLLVSLPTIYFLTRYQVYAEANKELSLMVDMVRSVQEYIRKDVRSDLMEAKLYHSPAISGATTISKIAHHFRTRQPNYYLKLAADNPLNQKNKSEPLESELIARYQANDKLSQLVETGNIQGKNYLVSTQPLIAKPACMLCHGNPSDAPQAITKAYGTTHGYGYKMNEVVGVNMVGVPLEDVNALVLKRVLLVAGIFTAIFTVIFFTINRLVKQRIIVPLVDITETAIAVSKGDLEHKVDVERDGSEIGELGHAFDLLRRSLVYAMKQMEK